MTYPHSSVYDMYKT